MPPATTPDPAAAARRLAAAALIALLLLDLAMFASMLAGIEPHPPGARGPFIAATAALAAATLWQTVAAQRPAVPLLALTALAFVPGVGPHKFLTEAAARDLAPVIVVGSGALVALLLAAWRLHRLEREPQGPSRLAAAGAPAPR